MATVCTGVTGVLVTTGETDVGFTVAAFTDDVILAAIGALGATGVTTFSAVFATVGVSLADSIAVILSV